MIVLVGHNASRTGAPRYLLNFADWLVHNQEEEVVVILRGGGELLGAYRKITKTYLWHRNTLMDRILHRLGFDTTGAWHRLLARKYLNKAHLVFNNTSSNGEILSYLEKEGTLISRIAEMGFALRNLKESLCLTLSKTRLVIAVSEAVREGLVSAELGLPQHRSKVFYGSVSENSITVEDKNVRGKLNLGSRVVVCGSGSINWRKGIDLFVEVARYAVDKLPDQDIAFLWLGKELQPQARQEIEEKIADYELQDHVILAGEVANPYDYYEAIDLFLMTSREDPFPLVNVEVGLLQKPIITFAENGGAQELIRQISESLIIPNFDVNAMGKKVVSLIQNGDERRDLGMQTYLAAKKHAETYTYANLYSAIME